MVDERLAIKDQTASLQRREEELKQREAQLTKREQLLLNPPKPPKSKSPFTSAPFLAAKSILMLGRS